MQVHPLHFKQFLILLDQGIARFLQDADQGFFIQFFPEYAITGRRPTNSGIRPNLKRSWGCTLTRVRPCRRLTRLCTSATNPMVFLPVRVLMISSRPLKAPPQINRMLVVSTLTNSCWGCLRPPWEVLGHRAFNDFQQRLLDASPLTSRVMDGLSLFRAILSISSIYTIPFWPLDVIDRNLQQVQDDVLNVFST